MKPTKFASGKWQARYNIGVGAARRTRSAGTFATRREAQQALDVIAGQVAEGRWADPRTRRITVADWAARWCEARPPRRKRTSFLNAHILPQWGDWLIGDIRNLDVRAWVCELAETLAPETVRGVYSLFSQMMADAAHEDVITRSPCRPGRDGLPTVLRTRENYLTPLEARRLLAAVLPRYRAMFALALATGMRWAELAALRWSAVDLDAGMIAVTEAVKAEDRAIGLPKGDKVRRVVLDDATVAVLRAHPRSGEFVFTAPRGGRLNYAAFRRDVMVPAAAALDLDWLTFHALRHTAASNLLNSGVSAHVVAAQLGHSRASFTIDRYGHAAFDGAEVLRAAMGRLG